MNVMRITYESLLIIPVLLFVSFAPAQTSGELNHRIDLKLEMKKGDSVQVMDPTHVFSESDLIRFRLHSSINGFLYVINQGSSGEFVQLFPHDKLIQSRQLTAGKDYLVPDGAWFMLKEPPGYETVYFLISPVDLGKSLPDAAYPPKSAPGSQINPDTAEFGAKPRCDDEFFRARGECLDSDAGLKPIEQGESLPERLPPIPVGATRDIVIVKDSKDTSISSAQPFDAPAIYRFRISHK